MSNPKTLFGIYCELDSGTEVLKESLLLCSGGLLALFGAHGGSNLGKFFFPHLWSYNRMNNVVVQIFVCVHSKAVLNIIF